MARRVGSRVVGCLLAGALLLLSMVVFGSAPVTAGPYPPTQCATLSVSTTTPDAGETMAASGTGFTARDRVTLELRSGARVVGRATVRADGTFSTQITIPKDVSGKQLLVVVGGQPACSVGPVTLYVRASAILGEQIGPNGSGGGSGLASTGVQIALLIAIAALALITGVALNRAGRRKRSQAA